MFTDRRAYLTFRATIKIWLPQLLTLDGTTFVNDQDNINELKAKVEASKASVRQQCNNASGLPTIREEGRKAMDDEDVFASLKAKQQADNA